LARCTNLFWRTLAIGDQPQKYHQPEKCYNRYTLKQFRRSYLRYFKAISTYNTKMFASFLGLWKVKKGIADD
ncbi:MAG: hypothetical protein ACK5GJ_10055, partial [Planctomycetota bacterium]